MLHWFTTPAGADCDTTPEHGRPLLILSRTVFVVDLQLNSAKTENIVVTVGENIEYLRSDLKIGTACANEQCYSGVVAPDIISLLNFTRQSSSRLRGSSDDARNYSSGEERVVLLDIHLASMFLRGFTTRLVKPFLCADHRPKQHKASQLFHPGYRVTMLFADLPLLTYQSSVRVGNGCVRILFSSGSFTPVRQEPVGVQFVRPIIGISIPLTRITGDRSAGRQLRLELIA